MSMFRYVRGVHTYMCVVYECLCVGLGVHGVGEHVYVGHTDMSVGVNTNTCENVCGRAHVSVCSVRWYGPGRIELGCLCRRGSSFRVRGGWPGPPPVRPPRECRRTPKGASSARTPAGPPGRATSTTTSAPTGTPSATPTRATATDATGSRGRTVTTTQGGGAPRVTSGAGG